MTCLEKFKLEHPGHPCLRCPHTYGYAERPKQCYEMSCIECWNREYIASTDKADKEDKNV